MSAAKYSSGSDNKGNKHPLITGLRDDLSTRFPQYKTQVHAIAPFVVKAADAFDAIMPYVNNAYRTAKPIVIQAYHASKSLYDTVERNQWKEFGPLIFGLVLCFFGGTYMTLIAAIEAVRLSVWDRLFASLKVLYDNYKVARAASKKDDDLDNDGNGVKDVQELTAQQLVNRKVGVFMSAADPNQVAAAAANAWGGLLIVIATVKSASAQAITLGASLGEIVDARFHGSFEEVAEKMLRPEHKKWAGTLATWTCKAVTAAIAILLRRVIVGIYAAIRGSKMAADAALRIAQQRQLLTAQAAAEWAPKISIAAGLLAFFGFYWQLTHAFGLPLPLSIVLLPVTLLEWVLEILVAVI